MVAQFTGPPCSSEEYENELSLKQAVPSCALIERAKIRDRTSAATLLTIVPCHRATKVGSKSSYKVFICLLGSGVLRMKMLGKNIEIIDCW